MHNAAFIHNPRARHETCGNRRTMSRNRPRWFDRSLPVGLGALGLALSVFSQAGLAQSRDPTVTSDSPEYCGVLLDRISSMTRVAAMPPPTEAATLSEAGEWMCVHGQTRGGIMRLRRALAIIRGTERITAGVTAWRLPHGVPSHLDSGARRHGGLRGRLSGLKCTAVRISPFSGPSEWLGSCNEMVAKCRGIEAVSV